MSETKQGANDAAESLVSCSEASGEVFANVSVSLKQYPVIKY